MRMSEKGPKKIINKSLWIMIVLNIVLALVSFLKDMLMAGYLGTGVQADTLFATFFIPDAIGFNILGQTAALILVPTLVTLFEEDKEAEAYGVTLITSIIFSMISTFAVLLLIKSGSGLFASLSAGNGNIDQKLSIRLFSLLIPILYTVPMAYAMIAFLNAKERFITTTFAPLVFNIGVMAAVVISMGLNLPPSKGVVSITLGISCASLLMMMYLLSQMPRGMSLVKSVKLSLNESERLKRLGLQALILVLIFLIYQSVLYGERIVAFLVKPGGISALNYAYRFSQFPLWVFIAALLVMILPEMSKHHAIEDFESLYNKFHEAWLLLLIAIIPVALIMCLFRYEILTIVFLRGAFTLDSLMMTSQIMMGYALSIVFQSISYLLMRLYLVYNNLERVLIGYLISSALVLMVDFTFYKIIGLQVIGLGALIGWGVNALILFVMGEPKMKKCLLEKDTHMHRAIFLSNLFAILPVILTKWVLNKIWIQDYSMGTNFMILLICGIEFMMIYGILLVKLKVFPKILRY